MNFLRANIDRAIVVTQYDLRGFDHPLGFRCKEKSPKSLDAITGNLVGFCAGLGTRDKNSTDENYADYHDSTYDDYLAMCKRLFKDCDSYQKEAIKFIVLEIVKQSEEMKAEVAAGKRETSVYLKALNIDNRWGKVVLSLAEVFDIKLDQATPAATVTSEV